MLARQDFFSNNHLGLKLIRKRVSTPDQFDPYKPEPFQLAIHTSKAKYNALIGSPGLGKTVVGAIETVRFMKNGEGNGLIVLPTFGMAFDVAMRELKKWAPTNVYIPNNPSNQTIKLPKNRVIFIRSADYPKSIEGLDQVTFVWMDEPEEINEKIFQLVKQRLHRQKSGLSRKDRLRVVITGVADLKKGRSWVKDFIKNGYEKEIERNIPKNERTYFFRKATIFESGRYTEEEKQQIKKENPPGTWSRNRYEGLYVPDPGFIVYPKLPEIVSEAKYEPSDCLELVAGVDCGYRDPFVFLLIGIIKINDYYNYIVFDEIRTINQTEKIIANKIYEKLINKNINKLTIYHDHDPLQVRNIRENLRKLDINNQLKLIFKPAYKYNSFDKSIHLLRDLFIREKIHIYKESENLFYDLASYKYKEKGEKEAVEHEFSHSPDALRYAIYTHNLINKHYKIYT